jgi:hypothetical protein
MDLLLGAIDCAFRAILQTQQAGRAFFWIYIIGNQGLARERGTALVLDVRFILLFEIAERAQERIWSSLAERAQRHHLRQFR